MIVDTSKIGPFIYGTKPYKHQDDEFLKSRDQKIYALFWEMGVGKSKPIIDTAAHLFLKCEIDGLVLISDKGAYLNWYNNEVPIHMPKNIPFRMAYWSAYSTQNVKAKRLEILKAKDDCLDILCVNIEALSTDNGTQFVEKFLRSHYSMMVIDESTSIKNLKASRTKAAIQLGRLADYRRIMTGTPITQSPMDLYAQCEFLEPGLLGFNSFMAFRSYYAQLILQQFGSRKPFYQIVGFKNLDQLTARLTRFSSRLLKTECLDLPSKIYETIYVEHTPEQHNLYQSLKRTAIAQLDQGLMTSTNALTTILKLHQVNCGHVKLDTGEQIDIPTNRIEIMLGLLENLPGKTIIWCAFQRDVELVMQALSKMEDGYAVDYYGLTSDENRASALKNFKSDPRCRWFVGTTATGGKGLTLVEANTTIYYSNTYNLEKRLQSEDRNHRIGQKEKVTYIDLVTPNTVDVKILESLKTKKDLASEVLDNLRTILEVEDSNEISFL